jgi:EAL domain-containing protein (putative c-di-GMP-specific phosphodiesterase class I)
VPPDKFIPLAETNGDINALGDWILAQACHDLGQLSSAGYGRTKMAVNVSVVQLRDAHFAERCLKTICACGASAACLELELTESMLLHDRDAVVRQLRQLREHGVSIAIDDFGTGFSSLSYLQHLPMDKVKIDRSFIMSMNQDVDARAIVRVIVGLAHSLQVRCVAEGVESEDTRQALTELGCDQAQGFLFARPMALPQLLAWLDTRGCDAADDVSLELPVRPERRFA